MSTMKTSTFDSVPQRNSALSRRKFLVAAIALSGLASGMPGLSVLRRAWAQSVTPLEEDVYHALVQMARRLYPHDSIPDEVYAQVLDDVLAATANDESFVEMLQSAEQVLNSQQPTDFIDLGTDAQIEAMRAVEQMSFFAAIRWAVYVRLYNHSAIWNLIGYEGPSFQQGGYLNRGAGEIDWLPEVE
ncbi:MAG: hypothetical protein ACR2QT_08170 [Woeseiaceae bacterium]